MTFEEALKAMREGKKVRLKDWSSSVSIGLDKGNIYWFSRGSHGSSPAILSSNAIMLEEWEIYQGELKIPIEKVIEFLQYAKAILSLHVNVSINDYSVEDVVSGIDQAILLLQEKK